MIFHSSSISKRCRHSELKYFISFYHFPFIFLKTSQIDHRLLPTRYLPFTGLSPLHILLHFSTNILRQHFYAKKIWAAETWWRPSSHGDTKFVSNLRRMLPQGCLLTKLYIFIWYFTNIFILYQPIYIWMMRLSISRYKLLLSSYITPHPNCH